VRFQSATTPPTPLQQRLFKERGQPIAVPSAVELTGEFYRPAGDGPFPAVVQLHGCSGRGSRVSEDAAGARIVALGYALLIVDSFGPRGIKERCGVEIGPPVDRVMDAYGALLWLAQQPFIDPERIALLGYSQGAMVALSAVTLDGVGTLFDWHFRAAIAYYPLCSLSDGAVSVPTLILIGDLDDWTPARYCQAVMAGRSGAGAPIKLAVYPGAYHAFNAASLRDKPRSYFGHHLEYNEAADRAAQSETIAALRQAFGR
jgi:dienelactone hydrolase